MHQSLNEFRFWWELPSSLEDAAAATVAAAAKKREAGMSFVNSERGAVAWKCLGGKDRGTWKTEKKEALQVL